MNFVTWTNNVWPCPNMHALFGCLAGLIQQRFCLACALKYSVWCVDYPEIHFVQYHLCLIEVIFWPLLGIPGDQTQQRIAVKRPVPKISLCSLFDPVLRKLYPIRLTKLELAARPYLVLWLCGVCTPLANHISQTLQLLLMFDHPWKTQLRLARCLSSRALIAFIALNEINARSFNFNDRQKLAVYSLPCWI